MQKTFLGMTLAFILCSTAASAETIVLQNLRLINGHDLAPVENATLVIEDGLITAAGADISADFAGADIRDYSGKTVAPGFVSNHVHIGQVDGVTNGTPNFTRGNILAALDQYARYGITTVLALGLNGEIFPAIRQEAHAGKISGADVFGADRGIGVPDGAPPQAMLKVGPDQLFRPRSAEEAREAVRLMKARGTDVVKLWLDDFGGSLPQKMSPDVYSATIDEAHKNGLRVAAHVHDLADARAIVAAGADILAHGVRDEAVDEDFIRLMKQKGTWYIPTLALDEATFVYAERPAWTQSPFVQQALSPDLAARFNDAAWQKETAGSTKAAAARRSLAMNKQNLKTLYDAGVKIGFGTDSGAVPERIPGVAEHRELALMVEAGLPPAAALRIATGEAAALMGLDDRGQLLPGRRADFTVFSGNPAENISQSADIAEVWRGGKQISAPTSSPLSPQE